jgi:twitching motility protein PilT
VQFREVAVTRRAADVAMKQPGSGDDDLGMPVADELWPHGDAWGGGADDAGTRQEEIRTPSADGSRRLDTPRPPAAIMPPPPSFPVAPPIRPLSFSDALSDGGVIEAKPTRATVDAPQPETVRMETPMLPEAPRPPVASAPIVTAPPSYLRRGTHRSVTVGTHDFEQLLRAATARGASTVYLRAGVELAMRVRGEFQVLEGAPVLSADEIEMLLVALKLAHDPHPRRLLTSAEWAFELENVGEIRCTVFIDHRGAGAMFEIVPFRAGADQIALSLDVRQLAGEREGLVIVTGARGAGKLLLMHQLAHWITRGRRSYVIAVQRGRGVRTTSDDTSLSQREVRDGLDDMLAVARAALREDPDVLVLHHARSASLMNLALDAAATGHLVIAGITAPSAPAAIDRIVELYSPEQSRSVQLQLSQHLRAVVGQVLVPRIRGGSVAAQEVMPMTPAIAAVLADGRAWQLRSALDAGGMQGIVPLGDGLLALVRAGEVRPEDAYHYAPDQAALLERFARHGIDTSFSQTSRLG